MSLDASIVACAFFVVDLYILATRLRWAAAEPDGLSLHGRSIRYNANAILLQTPLRLWGLHDGAPDTLRICNWAGRHVANKK